MTRLNLGLLLASTSALALPSVAAAQSAPPPAQSGQAQAVQEIVVTGSRVIQNGNNSPTPLTVMGVDDALKLQPTTIADALNDLPEFSGSKTQTSNPQAGTAIQMGGGNSSGQYLNLRNMGAVRTLILMDGQRVPPTSANGIVDVDEIPSQLVQRVDVVTGGASAVYGSDAVSGVVNYVIDKNFNGLKANAQMGASELGDDRNIKFGLAAGTALFGGKGHIEISYDYFDDGGVPYRYGGARDPNYQVWSIQGNGTTIAPYFETPNARTATSTFGGLIPGTVTPTCPLSCATATNPLGGMTFDQNGVLTPFVHGTPTIPGSTTVGNEIGGDGIYNNTALKASQLQNQFFGRLDYDFTDTMHGYVDVSASDKVNTTHFTWQNLNKVTLSSTDAFLPAAYQALLLAPSAGAPTGNKTFIFSKQFQDADRIEPTTNENVLIVNAGLNGQLGAYHWNVGVVHGSSILSLVVTNNLNNGRLYAALDAVKDGAGNIVCSVTLTNPTLYPGCVPLNPFGPTADNPAALKWAEQSTTYQATTTMDDFSGSIAGSPFATWAGPVNVAGSGEWRKVGYSSTSNALSSSNLDCTGLRFNCSTNVNAPTPLWNNSQGARSLVSETVGEGALEADVPVLKDKFLVESLNLNGAVRYTAYSISGNYMTWKIGVDWHATEEVRFRGTRSRDIRAPTLDDLYAPTSVSIGTGNVQDFLTNQTIAGGVKTIVTGNPNLTSEIGDTWTGGVVYRPRWLAGASVSFDYFNSTVTNAIFPILAGNATVNRACVASGGTSPYCQTIVRPFPYTNTTPANNLTAQYSESLNIASQFTQGVDIEANYATKIFDRVASVRWLTTYQPDIRYYQPGAQTLNQAGAAFGNNAITSASVWRGTIFLHFVPITNFFIDTSTQWRTGLRPAGDPTLVFANGTIPPASFTNLTLTYRIKNSVGQSDLFLNVVDLFNPPLSHISPFTNLGPGQQYNYPASDPGIGRAFTFGIRFRH